PGLGLEERVFYRVQKGDTLAAVAKALGVDAHDLVKWNGLDASAALQPKMVLAARAPNLDRKRVAVLEEREVHVVEAGGAEHIEAVLKERGKKRLVVQAVAGD